MNLQILQMLLRLFKAKLVVSPDRFDVTQQVVNAHLWHKRPDLDRAVASRYKLQRDGDESMRGR